MPAKFPISTADLRGLIRLITDATVGVTDLVEAMHHRIVHPPNLPSTPVQDLISGLASVSFNSTRLVTKVVGAGLDETLSRLELHTSQSASSVEKEVLLGVLNGVVGDYLDKSNNPLAIPMQLKHRSKTINLDPNSIKDSYPNVNGKILLMVHGLCMNDVMWRRDGHDHGMELVNELDFTPVYLHYNGGRHISTNGQYLSAMLEELLNSWPVSIEELVIVGYSMGGLLSRSAFFYGEMEGKSWTRYLKKIVFLGTPHHGAPLEKAGNYIDIILAGIPYTKPFARLARIRSEGITDLRYGNLLDDDWQGIDRFHMRPDGRKHIPLPKGVDCYNIVASTSEENSKQSCQLKGDGMVSLNSALGKHKNPDRNLRFEENHTLIVYGCSHMDLLSNHEVYEKLKVCLLA